MAENKTDTSKLYPDARACTKWEYADVTCYLMLHPMGHYCGYVRFAERPLVEDGYDGIATYVPVHGGITYASQDEGGFTYGFDCAHFEDDGNADCQDQGWLRRQCELLADSLKAAAKIETAYLAAATNEDKAVIIDAYHASNPEHPFDMGHNFLAMVNVMTGEL